MAFLDLLLRWGQFFLIMFAIGLPLNFIVGNLVHAKKWWGELGKTLFVPGAIIHELGHAVACFVTGKRITGTDFGTNPLKGGHVNFQNTGICTPLALHAVGYAPVFSCGIVVALILQYIGLNEASFKMLDWAIWMYLLISVAAGAAPSLPDMRIAFHSLGERPRVTAVEAISIAWPIFLPDLLGLTSDMALLTYLVAMVGSYIILWKLLVSTHPHRARKGLGHGYGLPGDGRDPGAIKWPSFRQSPALLNLPRTPQLARASQVTIPIATAEDVYRAAGLKVKIKKQKHDVEVILDA
jgi:hypothetical protein